MIEVILLFTLFGFFLCFAFIKGIQIGQCITNNKIVEMPSLNFVKKVQETRKSKEEQERLNTIIDNIENYDGTELGQKEV